MLSFINKSKYVAISRCSFYYTSAADHFREILNFAIQIQSVSWLAFPTNDSFPSPQFTIFTPCSCTPAKYSVQVQTFIRIRSTNAILHFSDTLVLTRLTGRTLVSNRLREVLKIEKREWHVTLRPIPLTWPDLTLFSAIRSPRLHSIVPLLCRFAP